MEITREQNITNMERCPRYQECNIPKCPLDFFMSERTELAGEEVCPLRKTITGHRSKRMKVRLSASLRGLSQFIPEKNSKMA